jgi:hypothetical protein
MEGAPIGKRECAIVAVDGQAKPANLSGLKS